MFFFFFFFNDTATTEIYTLSLHDALPICRAADSHVAESSIGAERGGEEAAGIDHQGRAGRDRKSTRLNSSHLVISYAVFCLKKKTTASTHLYASPTTATTLTTFPSRLRSA